MSIDGSSSEESPDHSTCGSSVSASESRKRIADASPDSSRRDFPGLVTRSAAGCRIYVPPITDGGDECPGRVLNDDGTIRQIVTVGQEEEVVTEIGVEAPLIFVEAANVSVDFKSPARAVPTLAISDVIVVMNPRLGSIAGVDTLPHTEPVSDLSSHAVAPTFSTSGTNTMSAPAQVIVLVDEWGRDTCVINEVCEFLETMPRPWSAYRAFEATSSRFPNIDRGALRLAVMPYSWGNVGV